MNPLSAVFLMGKIGKRFITLVAARANDVIELKNRARV